jgi:hypothetical protein
MTAEMRNAAGEQGQQRKRSQPLGATLYQSRSVPTCMSTGARDLPSLIGEHQATDDSTSSTGRRVNSPTLGIPTAGAVSGLRPLA